jgi:hypothetical protein
LILWVEDPSETSVVIYQTTWHRTPEDTKLEVTCNRSLVAKYTHVERDLRGTSARHNYVARIPLLLLHCI